MDIGSVVKSIPYVVQEIPRWTLLAVAGLEAVGLVGVVTYKVGKTTKEYRQKLDELLDECDRYNNSENSMSKEELKNMYVDICSIQNKFIGSRRRVAKKFAKDLEEKIMVRVTEEVKEYIDSGNTLNYDGALLEASPYYKSIISELNSSK